MATILDIANGISQVLSNTHDGAIDSDNEVVKIGLRREEGDPIKDSRVLDGFSARIQGDELIVSYQYDCKLKDVHDKKKFVSEVESSINDVVKFIKKEFRKLTKNSLSLSQVGETDILVQYLSRVRSTVIASARYKIGGLSQEKDPKIKIDKSTGQRKLDDAIKKFLELGNAGKRPKNDKSKKDNYKQFEPWNLESGQRNPNLK